MTTSALPHRRHRAQVTGAEVLSVFPTELGWIGVVGAGGRVIALSFGHPSPVGVRRELQRRLQLPDDCGERDWFPERRRRMESFAAGERVDFSDVEVQLGNMTPFRQAVVDAARAIDYGRTVTYGELAAMAGFPGAARAVGQVMATNPLPLIIPCHRVLGAGGRLGGYSARSGLKMKQRLLDMEQRTLLREALDSPASAIGRRRTSDIC